MGLPQMTELPSAAIHAASPRSKMISSSVHLQRSVTVGDKSRRRVAGEGDGLDEGELEDELELSDEDDESDGV